MEQKDLLNKNIFLSPKNKYIIVSQDVSINNYSYFLDLTTCYQVCKFFIILDEKSIQILLLLRDTSYD